MGIIKNWASKRQTKEAEAFTRQLKSMDADEIAFVVLLAANYRNNLKTHFGWDLQFPSFALHNNPDIPLFLTQTIKQHQKEGMISDATAGMVWFHTCRAFNDGEIRIAVRGLWRELARGFEIAKKKQSEVALLASGSTDFTGFDQIPDGLALNYS